MKSKAGNELEKLLHDELWSLGKNEIKNEECESKRLEIEGG